jgi:hypothetical protein
MPFFEVLIALKATPLLGLPGLPGFYRFYRFYFSQGI